MVKKTDTTDAIVKVDNVGKFELTDAALALATRFGLNLADAKEARVERAAQNMNRSMHAMVAAGLDLASLQADCEHGEFLALIQERGFEQRGAYRAISYTRFLLSRSDAERELLLTMPKSKVLALAGADASVIDDLLAEGEDGELGALSVRELRERLRQREADLVDLTVEKEAAEVARDDAVKKLNRHHRRDEDDTGVPVVMADLRAEFAALVKKAELAIDSFTPLGTELMGFRGHAEAGEWVGPTGRMALTGLLALRLQADGAIKRFVDALELSYTDFEIGPEPLSFLTPQETTTVAQQWHELTVLHGHEAALRAHDREQAKPKGKGRPAKAPVLPRAK